MRRALHGIAHSPAARWRLAAGSAAVTDCLWRRRRHDTPAAHAARNLRPAVRPQPVDELHELGILLCGHRRAGMQPRMQARHKQQQQQQRRRVAVGRGRGCARSRHTRCAHATSTQTPLTASLLPRASTQTAADSWPSAETVTECVLSHGPARMPGRCMLTVWTGESVRGVAGRAARCRSTQASTAVAPGCHTRTTRFARHTWTASVGGRAARTPPPPPPQDSAGLCASATLRAQPRVPLSRPTTTNATTSCGGRPPTCNHNQPSHITITHYCVCLKTTTGTPGLSRGR
jgi:hypothetical protein